MSDSADLPNGDEHSEANEQNGSADGMDELFGDSADSAIDDEGAE